MTPSLILNIYVVLLLLELSFSLVLDWLNVNFIKTNSTTVPEYLKDSIDEETHKKSVKYSLVKLKFSMVSTLINGGILLALVLSGSFGLLDNWIVGLDLNIYGEGVLYFLIFSLSFYFLSLPFSLYSTFVIEESFGFNKTTPKLWIFDQIKSILISSIFLVLMVAGLLWFMSTTGDRWWIYGFIFVATIQLFLVYIYPLWIAPLFNKFTELSDEELKNKIQEVTKKAGYKAEAVFVMDGSRRSKHANAYFTGFGKGKRIVLYDTLIETLNENQLLSVLAHEIGHEKLNHIKKGLLMSLAILLVGFYIINLLINYEPLFFAFGFDRTSYHGALVLFSFASAPITFWLSPLFSRLSRIHEYEADSFAVKIMNSITGLKTALVELSKKSLSNFTPHPLYSFFHYSHPTLHERIKAMEGIDVKAS